MSRFTARAVVLLQVVAAVLVVADPCNDVTADEVDGYLSQHDSVLEGLGDVFVDQGRRWDVDPRLVIAIAQQETSLGRAGACSRYHNPFNWFYCASSRCTPPACTPCADADPVDVKCERSAY